MPILRAPVVLFRRPFFPPLAYMGPLPVRPSTPRNSTVRPATTIVELLQVDSEEVVEERQTEQGSHIPAVKPISRLPQKQKIG